jgi:hypothetical protein
MVAGKPNRFALMAALFVLVVANAVVSGHRLSRMRPESRQALHVSLQSPQRALFSRTPLPKVTQSSPEQIRFTIPAVWAHWPVANSSVWLQLPRAATWRPASGMESASGRGPPLFL